MRVRVCHESEVHETRGFRVVADGRDIALFRRGGTLYAICNVCAHQHLSVLHQGRLQGLTVTCPMHGWTYDLATGESTTVQGRVETYPVISESGSVYVELPDSP